MKMNIYIVGDLHGHPHTIQNFYRNHIKSTPREQEENWIICLGDFGALYYFDFRDRSFKKELSKYPFKYFVIRGNHEERASIRAQMEPDLWEKVECFGNTCLRQPAFPNIYYALDEGGIYNIAGRRSLVIPGAYSVDKLFRLTQGWRWFQQEQLAPFEMDNLEKLATGKHFDLVLSHTCPYRYRPTDLFLSSIDQSKVDNSMEIWMDRLIEKIDYGVHCWGHFHGDRVEAPYCEMFFEKVESLEDVETRWDFYEVNGELPWWIPKSPHFGAFE
jgi:3-oxoacid CoA-transferase subunit A